MNLIYYCQSLLFSYQIILVKQDQSDNNYGDFLHYCKNLIEFNCLWPKATSGSFIDNFTQEAIEKSGYAQGTSDSCLML